MKIYVLGNQLLDNDSLPLQMVDDLKKEFPNIDFVVVDPNENFPPVGEKDLIIIDTVINIKEPLLLDLNDIEGLKRTPISPHDYDLLFHLLLLKKLRRINKVVIIGIPSNRNKKHLPMTVELLRTYLGLY